MTMLTFKRLRDAVGGDAVALRSRMTLQPAGGEGDKVFPPSYAVESRAEHKYAVEKRQVGDGDRVSITVLLDSVASQANRAELALLEGWERGELLFPVPYVDFSDDGGVTDYDKLTVLEAPPPARGCNLPRQPARRHAVPAVRRRTRHHRRDAAQLNRPLSLLPYLLAVRYVGLDRPEGGLGSKFQRAYVSEIVGFDARVGESVGGRIDPVQIEKVAREDRVFKSTTPDEVWTLDLAAAERDNKGNPVLASRRAIVERTASPRRSTTVISRLG